LIHPGKFEMSESFLFSPKTTNCQDGTNGTKEVAQGIAYGNF
jgi:hypothetical protein